MSLNSDDKWKDKKFQVDDKVRVVKINPNSHEPIMTAHLEGLATVNKAIKENKIFNVERLEYLSDHGWHYLVGWFDSAAYWFTGDELEKVKENECQN